MARQARTLLLDETSFFVSSMGAAKNGSVVMAFEYFAPCFYHLDSQDETNPGDLLFLALPV